MKNIVAAVVFSLALAPLASQAAGPELVPPSVVHVIPIGASQLVVFSVCSPEHCWHTFYLRQIDWSEQPKVVCRKPITELNEAADFIAESISPAPGSADQLELHMISSHDAFRPQAVKLNALGGCRYELGQLPRAAANNSSKPTPLRGAA